MSPPYRSVPQDPSRSSSETPKTHGVQRSHLAPALAGCSGCRAPGTGLGSPLPRRSPPGDAPRAAGPAKPPAPSRGSAATPHATAWTPPLAAAPPSPEGAGGGGGNDPSPAQPSPAPDPPPGIPLTCGTAPGGTGTPP